MKTIRRHADVYERQRDRTHRFKCGDYRDPQQHVNNVKEVWALVLENDRKLTAEVAANLKQSTARPLAAQKGGCPKTFAIRFAPARFAGHRSVS